MLIWLKRPTSHKANSIIRKLGHFPYKLILTIFRWLKKTRIISNFITRCLVFDIANKDSLLISETEKAKFIVSAADIALGRTVYSKKMPHEFEKLTVVMELLNIAHQKKILIDIGANIGTISIAAVSHGFFEKAISIEPEPSNYSLLVANVHINKLAERILTINKALGNRNDESLEFELCIDNHGDHRVRTNNNEAKFEEESRSVIRIISGAFDKLIPSVELEEALI